MPRHKCHIKDCPNNSLSCRQSKKEIIYFVKKVNKFSQCNNKILKNNFYYLKKTLFEKETDGWKLCR